MHVLYVIPYFAPAWGYGGPPRIMYDAARRLIKLGHQVTVLTTDSLDGSSRITPRHTVLDGITVRYLPNLSNKLAWQGKIFLPFGFKRALRQVLGQVDLVHLSDFRSLQNAIAWREATSAGVPYVVSAFGQMPRGKGLKRALKALFDRRDGYALIQNAAALLAQTAHEVDCYQQLGGGHRQIRLVPLAVDLDEFTHLPARGRLRAAWGVSPNETLLLFVGRFHEYKGLALLLRTFAELSQERSDVRLALVGRDDGFLPTMERLIAELGLGDRVILPGPIYGPDRLSAYVDADIFAFSPSYFEETPTAGLEALACGTPVVVTHQGSIPWLTEYNAGLEVAHDQGEFGRALRSSLDPATRKQMAANAKRLIADHFSWEQVATNLQEIYQQHRRLPRVASGSRTGA